MLTRRGWSMIGAAIGFFAGAWILGLVELSVLGAACALLVAAAFVWVRRRAPRLAGRRLLKERLQVGVEGRVDVTLVGAGGRGATTAVADAFDEGRRAARFLLPPLREGEEAHAAYRYPTDRRGRYSLGPLRATVTDPFGCVTIARQVLGTETVTVYPRVHDIAEPAESGGLDLDRDHPRVRARTEVSGEFMTLREYAPGDDLRYVHWRSTARRGELMMRQHEARRRAPVRVVLDVRPEAHDRASFERAVEDCASVAAALDRAGRPFEVALSTGARIGSSGRRHFATIMDELAVVQPHGPAHFAAPGHDRVGALVAITGALSTDDSAVVGRCVRDGGTLLVIDVGSRPSAPPAGTRRIRSVVIRHDADVPFPHVWNEAMLRWHRSGTPSSTSVARR